MIFNSHPPQDKIQIMFDFEKLEVYRKSRELHSSIRKLLSNKRLDRATSDQLMRSSLSVVLNIAEGSGRFSRRDRRHFYVVSRSSAFEVAAILDILKSEQLITIGDFNTFYDQCEEISRILFRMIKNLGQ